jgi:hypothetical protein
MAQENHKNRRQEIWSDGKQKFEYFLQREREWKERRYLLSLLKFCFTTDCTLFSTAHFNKLEHGEKVSLRWQRHILARMNSLCYISYMFRGIVVVASEVGTRDKPQMIFFVFLSKLHWYLFFCRLSAARQYFLAGYSLLFSVSYHHVLPRWF